MHDRGSSEAARDDAAERRALKWVLAINLTQVAAAGSVGIASDSAGLIGAALDNLSDAAVYAVSLYAVGRTAVAKSRAATLSGVLLMVVAFALAAEIVRRFVGASEPVGIAMIVTAIVNAATNALNLRLLRPHRDRGVHMSASRIFTANDMVVNGGIVVSGIAVATVHSPLPDLLIGLVLVGVVLNGAREILKDAREARCASTDDARARGANGY